MTNLPEGIKAWLHSMSEFHCGNPALPQDGTTAGAGLRLLRDNARTNFPELMLHVVPPVQVTPFADRP